MSYEPSLEDLPTATPNAKTSGYEPSLEDLPQNNSPTGNFDFESLPFPIKMMLKAGSSVRKPLSQGVPERIAGIGAGLTHIGQGAKQLGLGAEENLGMIPYGSQDEYTKQKDLERKAYESSSAGRDPLSQMLTEQTESLPMMAALGPLGSKIGILKKILAGTTAGGAAGAAEYVPGGESRATNVLKGAGIGGGIPLAGGLIGAGAKIAGRALGDLGPLEAAEKAAQAKFEAALQSHGEAKAAAEVATKMSNPNKMQNVLETKEAQLAGMPEEKLSNLPVPSSQVSAENLDKAAKSHEAASKLVGDVERQLESELNKGSAHGLHNTSDINRKIDMIENHYSGRYENLMKNLENSHFQMPEAQLKEYELDMDAIREKVRQGNVHIKGEVKTNENPYVKELMDRAPTAKDVSAAEFMAKQKEFRNYRFNLTQQMKDTTPTDRLAIKNALKESSEVNDVINKALNEGLGEYKPEYEDINRGYSEIIFPLRSYNPVKSIRAGKETPKNFLNILGRKSAYTRTLKAQDALRQIVKSDPELMRNVIGQKYSSKLKGLHNYDETIQEYLDRLPNVKKLIEKHKEAINQVPLAKKQMEEAENLHKSIVSQESKGHEAASKEAQNIKNITANREKLQKEIDNLSSHIDELKTSAKRKDISLHQKIRIENRLKDAKEKKKDAIKKLMYIGGGAATLSGIPYYVNRAAQPIMKELGEE